jgi:hypothetical protein
MKLLYVVEPKDFNGAVWFTCCKHDDGKFGFKLFFTVRSPDTIEKNISAHGGNNLAYYLNHLSSYPWFSAFKEWGQYVEKRGRWSTCNIACVSSNSAKYILHYHHEIGWLTQEDPTFKVGDTVKFELDPRREYPRYDYSEGPGKKGDAGGSGVWRIAKIDSISDDYVRVTWAGKTRERFWSWPLKGGANYDPGQWNLPGYLCLASGQELETESRPDPCAPVPITNVDPVIIKVPPNHRSLKTQIEEAKEKLRFRVRYTCQWPWCNVCWKQRELRIDWTITEEEGDPWVTYTFTATEWTCDTPPKLF